MREQGDMPAEIVRRILLSFITFFCRDILYQSPLVRYLQSRDNYLNKGIREKVNGLLIYVTSCFPVD
jgi:hypothetical protein